LKRSCRWSAELPHAARAVGVLIAVLYVAIGLNDFDAVPVGIELVGQHHRQTGLDAGAHLRAMGDNCYEPRIVDADVDVRGEPRFRRGPGRKAAESDTKAEHQPGTDADAAEDAASAEVFDRNHAPDSAACLIAARMRW
jgi:hypothetical protein